MAEEAKILAVSGAVEARLAREGEWVSASNNMEIAEGGGIRTKEDGRAVVLMPNKTKVWLKEGSALEIEQRQTLASRLALVFGKIKIRVPHLMRKEKFEVRTPVSVCAVRGTEFTLETTEQGKMDLKVLFGEVNMKFTVPPAKGKAEFNIPQGQGLTMAEEGKANKPVLLTAKQERAAMENWNPGLSQKQRQAGLVQKENDRAQIQSFAKVTTQAENTVKGFLNVVKESDLEAGRTLTDVHGNLVRVDQRMIRPDASTIQFMNLVKRPVYNNNDTYCATHGFHYAGGQVANRLDLGAMTMGFNKDLPQRIEEWPSFFGGNDIDPTYASFVMANRTNASDIFFVAEGYRYDAARDELVDNLAVFMNPGATLATSDPNDRHTMITGVLKDGSGAGETAQDMLNAITRLQIRDTVLNFRTGEIDYSSGNLEYWNPLKSGGAGYVAMDSVGATDVDWGIAYDGPAYKYSSSGDNSPLVDFRADAYVVGNDITGTTANNAVFWYARENYVINNNGGLRTTGSLTNSSQDPFTLLKDVAIQTVAYVKQSTSLNLASVTSSENARLLIDNGATGDYFDNRNIDIVIIPDLFVAGIQRMLPAFTELGD